MHSFSKEPNQVFEDATQKSYNRVRFQQAKPVLDCELNLLGDLSNPQPLAEQYSGNGVPLGYDAFFLNNLHVAGSDFAIGARRCMVRGNEVVLANNTMYRTRPYFGKVGPFPAGTFNVFGRAGKKERVLEVNLTGDLERSIAMKFLTIRGRRKKQSDLGNDRRNHAMRRSDR